jgi:hypothetical protein
MPKSEQKEQNQQEQKSAISPFLRNVILAAVLIAAFGIVYYIGYQKTSTHKLDAFAKCLTDHGVKMYGAYWCPHCAEQKELFGESFKFVPYVECGVAGNRSAEQQVCKDAGIHHFPTWQFPPVGERVEAVIPLADLSSRTGCPLQ